MADVYTVENALPAEELFGEGEKITVDAELFINLCIEYGRKAALEDYVTKVEHKYSLDKDVVRAIIGIEEVEEDE